MSEAPGAVAIVPFSPALAPEFERLNVEWLEKYFVVEPIDHEVLRDPQRSILDHGGEILFAVQGGRTVGTCALKHHGDGVFELTKMAVTASAQGRGVGRMLLSGALERYRALGGTRLYLESHDKLLPALKLYESAGFRHAPRPASPSVYARSNVYMVYASG